MDAAKLTLEFIKALFSWPVVVLILLLVFHKQIRSLLEGLRSLVDRVKKIDAFGVSLEVGAQMLKEAAPNPQIEAANADIKLFVSRGAYSTDCRAIFLAASITNPTDKPDQVVNWKLVFPALNIELEPSRAPHHLIGGLPWWPSPMVKLPPNELVQGSLYFRGVGAIAEELPEEPLRGEITATTLHRKVLSQDVEIYRLTTLQARAKSASV